MVKRTYLMITLNANKSTLLRVLLGGNSEKFTIQILYPDVCVVLISLTKTKFETRE